MKSSIVSLCLISGLATLTGCPQPVTIAACTPATCANGCCSAAGVCTLSRDVSACGLNGALCRTCEGAGAQCSADGVCNSLATDSGTPVVDAGNPCVDAPGDAVLGTFSLLGSTTVAGSAAMPAGIVAVTDVGGTLYGVDFDGWVFKLGTFPSLVLGAAVAKVIAPADVDAGVFLSGFLASTDTHLLGGYTGAGFSGKVGLIDLADAGVTYVNAPGNYTAVGASDAFIINGTGLGAAAGNGIYALRTATGVTAQLASFDASFNVGGSGLTGVTGTGVLLLGYATLPSFENFVRAVPEATYGPALSGGTSVALTANTQLVASGFDLSSVDGFEDSAIIVNGAFGASGPYTTEVKRVPVTVSGPGHDVVTVGTPSALLQENGSKCTRVLFTTASGTSLYFGLQDARGRRLVKITP